ncbi:hypothetical protein [Aquabacterium sp. J223]|uniref:hypothetical protein n=1 Tax=Aquabacterium sp. J223 TaxID=2898431 RepID=UPI0021ADB426|nr:hypothetical protein [Aquabacterium sp. J223]UUX95491.1 hypothetical protein LRS07_20165 [Aquabacterium sp. J223]
MKAKLVALIAGAALVGIAQAQSAVGEAARDTGAAAKAAVTPGDQNMGRTPEQPQRRPHGQ